MKEIENFLTKSECDGLITLAENAGLEKATIETPNGPILRESYRNNDRYMFDDLKLANMIYERIKDHVFEDESWKVCGVNERIRIYRYQDKQHFALHTDSSFKRSDTEKSFVTLLIYLNEGYEGGETDIFGKKTIEPKTGKALWFLHHLLHEGLPMKNGVKYLLRTDIMYKKQ